mgnify:CR=1 FL=1|tara:strand:- start:398 stop:649 length:252 start_codon:yes stop_codon:yes gene_type:complete
MTEKNKDDIYKNLQDGERYALFLMSLINPDLYPNKEKKIPINIEWRGSDKVRDFTLLELLSFIGMAFHILEHEYNDVIKKDAN